MQEKSLDILAIGAHPDDVEMTSGGWLALAARQGRRVGALHLSKGEMGTRGTVEQRVKGAEAAGKILGLTSVDFADLKDGHIWCDEGAVLSVVKALRRLRPAVVIAPWTVCHHPDHEQAAQVVIRAVHFAGKQKYEAEGAPHTVRGLVHARYSAAFEPSFYVDVSSVSELKRKAIECYSSQFNAKSGEPQTRLSNPHFLDQLLARGAAFGLSAGCLDAEAYRSFGPLVLSDPLAVFNAQPPISALMR